MAILVFWRLALPVGLIIGMSKVKNACNYTQHVSWNFCPLAPVYLSPHGCWLTIYGWMPTLMPTSSLKKLHWKVFKCFAGSSPTRLQKRPITILSVLNEICTCPMLYTPIWTDVAMKICIIFLVGLTWSINFPLKPTSFTSRTKTSVY